MGNNKIFVDSNFFVALYSPHDSLHTQAEVMGKKLLGLKIKLYLSNYIFSELATVLSQRAGKEKALVAGEYLLAAEGIITVFVDKDLQTESWQIFKETTRKNTSFVDCSTIAVMRAEGIESLLTFDQEDFAPLLKKHHLSLYK